MYYKTTAQKSCSDRCRKNNQNLKVMASMIVMDAFKDYSASNVIFHYLLNITYDFNAYHTARLHFKEMFGFAVSLRDVL